MKRLLSIAAMLCSCLLSGCGPTLDITPQEVESEINKVLSPGDSAEAIEAFFAKKGWSLSYDQYQNRYQSTIRHPESNYHAISIYLYVDDEKCFLRVEAKNTYTMP